MKVHRKFAGTLGQTLLEIVMVLVLFSLLLTSANLLFLENNEGVLTGRKLIDATRLGENALEGLQELDWDATGRWITKPDETFQDGFRIVLAAKNMRWNGKKFVASNHDTGYRGITVRVFPPEDDNPQPYQWEQLLVRK